MYTQNETPHKFALILSQKLVYELQPTELLFVVLSLGTVQFHHQIRFPSDLENVT